MFPVLKTIVFILAFIDGICSKELHVKEDLEIKDKDISDIMDILNTDDAYTKNERFARHLEAATESALEHIISELKHQNGNPTVTRRTPMQNLLRRIKQQLKRNNPKKFVLSNNEKIKRKYRVKNLGLTTEKMKM